MGQRKASYDCALFRNIILMDRIDFLKHVSSHVKHYSKKAVVELHDMEYVGFLLNGLGILTRILQNGEELPAKFISTNHLIDYSSNEFSEDRYELELCQECEVCWFERTQFYEYLNNHPMFYRQLFHCSVLERIFVDRFNEATSKSLAVEKIRDLLFWLSKANDASSFQLPTTYTKLSKMIGLSRDRIKESIMTLEDMGMIQQSGLYGIKIIDTDAWPD